MANSRLPDAQTPWTETDARVVLDQWRQSGDSLAEFARKRGVSAARLYWWRKRLGEQERSTTLISLVPAQVTGGVGSDDGFGVVVRLPNGISIERGDASPAWVAELIRELARPT
jgi:hypothetical protein